MSVFSQEIEETFKSTRFYLKVAGMTPGDKSFGNRFRLLFFYLCLLIFVLNFIDALFCEHQDSKRFMYMVNITISSTIILLRVSIILYHKKTIDELVRIMHEEFWNETNKDKEEKDIIVNSGRTAKKCCTALHSVSIFMVSSAIIKQLKLLYGTIMNKSNKTGRILPIRYCYPIDLYADPYYEIILILQILGYVSMCIFYSTLDAVFFQLTMAISGQFKVLQRRIRNFKCTNNAKKDAIYIRECIQMHQKLYRLCDTLENCFNKILLLQTTSTALYLCSSGYVLLTLKGNRPVFVNKILGIIAFLIELFSCCYVADNLTSESLAVADAAYHSNWINADKKVKKMIAIIIMRSQKPFYLTLSNFAPLDLLTFKAVTNTAYTLFTVLQSTINE